MKLNKFDEVQIDGLHPTNPFTNQQVIGLLQTFVLTRDVDGDVIPEHSLYPSLSVTHPEVTEPVPISRVVRVNGAPVHA